MPQRLVCGAAAHPSPYSARLDQADGGAVPRTSDGHCSIQIPGNSQEGWLSGAAGLRPQQRNVVSSTTICASIFYKFILIFTYLFVIQTNCNHFFASRVKQTQCRAERRALAVQVGRRSELAVQIVAFGVVSARRYPAPSAAGLQGPREG